MKTKLYLLQAMLLCLLITSCCPCEENPDLVIPEYIFSTAQVANETGYTVIGIIEYPLGGPVFLTTSRNEFYSVKRINPFSGILITFCWNIDTPPPFRSGALLPIHPYSLEKKLGFTDVFLIWILQILNAFSEKPNHQKQK